ASTTIFSFCRYAINMPFRMGQTVIEAPLNEDRSLAVIAEVKKLIPNKPIRDEIPELDSHAGVRPAAHVPDAICYFLRLYAHRRGCLAPGSCRQSRAAPGTYRAPWKIWPGCEPCLVRAVR